MLRKLPTIWYKKKFGVQVRFIRSAQWHVGLAESNQWTAAMHQAFSHEAALMDEEEFPASHRQPAGLGVVEIYAKLSSSCSDGPMVFFF